MFSNSLAFNNQVLNNYKTTSCKNIEKWYDESDLFFLALNTHDEEVVLKFMIKCKEMDLDVCLVKTTAQTCMWVEACEN